MKSINHIDGNPRNNDLENLVVIDDEEDYGEFFLGTHESPFHYNENPPDLNEQMDSPEFRLAALEMWQHLWTPRIQKMEKDIRGIVDNIDGIVGALEKDVMLWQEHLKFVRHIPLDDYDTQPQVEEAIPHFIEDEPEGCDIEKWGQEELPSNFWENDKLEPQVTKVTLWNDDKTSQVTIKFPDVKAALKFTQGIPF